MGRRRIIDWDEGFQGGTGPDGAKYMLQSEEIRYEPKWWDAMYEEPGVGSRRDWKDVPVGDSGHTKMGQVARAERYARQRLEEAERA